jgi:hypothetical protein
MCGDGRWQATDRVSISLELAEYRRTSCELRASCPSDFPHGALRGFLCDHSPDIGTSGRFFFFTICKDRRVPLIARESVQRSSGMSSRSSLLSYVLSRYFVSPLRLRLRFSYVSSFSPVAPLFSDLLHPCKRPLPMRQRMSRMNIDERRCCPSELVIGSGDARPYRSVADRSSSFISFPWIATAIAAYLRTTRTRAFLAYRGRCGIYRRTTRLFSLRRTRSRTKRLTCHRSQHRSGCTGKITRTFSNNARVQLVRYPEAIGGKIVQMHRERC